MQKSEVAVFRLRSFLCPNPQCKNHNEVFGNDPAPKSCLACGNSLPEKPEYDQVINVKKTVEPYKGT